MKKRVFDIILTAAVAALLVMLAQYVRTGAGNDLSADTKRCTVGSCGEILQSKVQGEAK